MKKHGISYVVVLLSCTVFTPAVALNSVAQRFKKSAIERLEKVKSRLNAEVDEFKKCARRDQNCDSFRQKIYITIATIGPLLILAATSATLYALMRKKPAMMPIQVIQQPVQPIQPAQPEQLPVQPVQPQERPKYKPLPVTAVQAGFDPLSLEEVPSEVPMMQQSPKAEVSEEALHQQIARQVKAYEDQRDLLRKAMFTGGIRGGVAVGQSVAQAPQIQARLDRASQLFNKANLEQDLQMRLEKLKAANRAFRPQ